MKNFIIAVSVLIVQTLFGITLGHVATTTSPASLRIQQCREGCLQKVNVHLQFSYSNLLEKKRKGISVINCASSTGHCDANKAQDWPDLAAAESFWQRNV